MKIINKLSNKILIGNGFSYSCYGNGRKKINRNTVVIFEYNIYHGVISLGNLHNLIITLDSFGGLLRHFIEETSHIYIYYAAIMENKTKADKKYIKEM